MGTYGGVPGEMGKFRKLIDSIVRTDILEFCDAELTT
jgi:hypothetical protein